MALPNGMNPAEVPIAQPADFISERRNNMLYEDHIYPGDRDIVNGAFWFMHETYLENHFPTTSKRDWEVKVLAPFKAANPSLFANEMAEPRFKRIFDRSQTMFGIQYVHLILGRMWRRFHAELMVLRARGEPTEDLLRAYERPLKGKPTLVSGNPAPTLSSLVPARRGQRLPRRLSFTHSR